MPCTHGGGAWNASSFQRRPSAGRRVKREVGTGDERRNRDRHVSNGMDALVSPTAAGFHRIMKTQISEVAVSCGAATAEWVIHVPSTIAIENVVLIGEDAPRSGESRLIVDTVMGGVGKSAIEGLDGDGLVRALHVDSIATGIKDAVDDQPEALPLEVASISHADRIA